MISRAERLLEMILNIYNELDEEIKEVLETKLGLNKTFVIQSM